MTTSAYSGPHEAFAGHGRSRHDHQPDDDHELELLQRARTGDPDTGQQLITSTLLHVLRSNRHYARNGTRIFDLLDAGRQGLAHALENFEPENKESFSSYASMCIRRHIEQALNLRPSAPPPQSASSGSRPHRG
jgi:DNA-directed RNA polymerase sigma subunit (sigma70/sigma32)